MTSLLFAGGILLPQLFKVFDDLLDNINSGLINGVCFFDLKKCFDTIDHKLLLYKLEKYGETALKWFENYLLNRTQAVCVNGSTSNFEKILTGVPQGSVLGPLLFLIFINDLPKCLKHTACNIFADDTEIHACGSTLSEVRDLLQLDTDNLAQWFFMNKLVVSETKCSSMLATCNRSLLTESLNVMINNVNINQVNSSRYLGIYPDVMLNWSDHIGNLCSNLAPKVGILRRLKHILPKESLLMIYQSTIQSVIDYCITVWGYAPSIYLDHVQSLQNRAARIITGNYDREVRGVDLVKDLGWFNIRQRRDYFMGLLVFKALNNMSPVYMTQMFTFSHEIGVYPTRSAQQNSLYVPKVSKQIFSQSAQFNGPRFWNSLPLEIRNADALITFKLLLKRFLLS